MPGFVRNRHATHGQLLLPVSNSGNVVFVHEVPFVESRNSTLDQLPQKLACTCKRCLRHCRAAVPHYNHSLPDEPGVGVHFEPICIKLDANSSLNLEPPATADFSSQAPAEDGNTNVDKLLCMTATYSWPAWYSAPNRATTRGRSRITR